MLDVEWREKRSGGKREKHSFDVCSRRRFDSLASHGTLVCGFQATAFRASRLAA